MLSTILLKIKRDEKRKSQEKVIKISIKGFVHKCGHYCANSNKKHCCRCQNPKYGYRFPSILSVCKICKGVMRKYGDGEESQQGKEST